MTKNIGELGVKEVKETFPLDHKVQNEPAHPLPTELLQRVRLDPALVLNLVKNLCLRIWRSETEKKYPPVVS